MKNNMPLMNKRILFISPCFFNYENEIRKELENEGAEVVFYDEKPVKTPFLKAVLKYEPLLLLPLSNKYYKEIISKHKNESFDYVLMIKCQTPSIRILKTMRKTFSNSKFCLYMWDSMNNVKYIKRKLRFFDIVSSFDNKDCFKYSNIKFRPLFFISKFKNDKQIKPCYDIAFCGSIHSDRYNILKKIESFCENNGVKMERFYYLQSKWLYYYYYITNKAFRDTSLGDFSYTKKSAQELAEIERKTNVIIDIQHPKQTGLTIRTIEILGMRKKLVTTNKEIVNYDFFNSNNIMLIDRENPKLNIDFFNHPYEDVDDIIYNKYELKTWIKAVLGLEEK